MSISNKAAGSLLESAVAKYLNWHVVVGSGSRPCMPGDIISEDWLGECKSHVNSGHTIMFRKAVWKKLCDEADSKHRFPVLIVDDGSHEVKNTWVLFRFATFPKQLHGHRYDELRINTSSLSCKSDDLWTIHTCIAAKGLGHVLVVPFFGDDVVVCPLIEFRELLYGGDI